MTWWQFSLNCQASELEHIEDLMLELGALSISISDAGNEPIYEPLPGTTPLWQDSILTATFGAEADPEDLHQQISGALPDQMTASLRRHGLQDQDWELV
jgi:ribosomal protein L11 methyltransferase